MFFQDDIKLIKQNQGFGFSSPYRWLHIFLIFFFKFYPLIFSFGNILILKTISPAENIGPCHVLGGNELQLSFLSSRSEVELKKDCSWVDLKTVILWA